MPSTGDEVNDILLNAAVKRAQAKEQAREWIMHEDHPPASDLYALLAAYGNFMALAEARWWAKYHGKDHNGEGAERIRKLAGE